MADRYNEREIVSCLYLQGTCPNGKCMDRLCRSGRCSCLDPEQMILLETQWTEKLEAEMTFRLIPFWKPEAGEACQEWNECKKPDQVSLIKMDMEDGRMRSCLRYIGKQAIPKEEKLMQAVPFIMGINSCFEIEKRRSTVWFCLEAYFGGGFLLKIMQEILAESLRCAICDGDLHQMALFIKDFFGELTDKCYEDEELNGCVRYSYEVIARSLGSRNMIPMKNKFRNLYRKWKERPLKCRGDLMKCLKERCGGWKNILLVLYLIQDIFYEKEIIIMLPDALSRDGLRGELEVIPDTVEIFSRIFRGILRMKGCQERDDIGSQLIGMARQSELDWEKERLTELYDRVENIIRTDG